mgnify:CR=1 FL=1
MTPVAIYLRVSTQRQADKDLSIPDQRKRIKAYCKARDFEIIEEYCDPGASAKDDNRPGFRLMIDDALVSNKRFEAIIVFAFSRFYRDEIHGELYVRKLADNGVSVVSATEEVGSGLAGETTRRIMGILAEMENRQRAARVKETMLENARQGFWCGGRPPYGYRTVTSEMRGETQKKKLEIDPKEAGIVRLVYELYLKGDRGKDLGIKNVVSHLNGKGYRYRNDRPFRTNEVQRILSASTYMGLHYYNQRKAGNGDLKDPSEWVEMDVPAIIDPDAYDAVKKMRESRRPANTSPRITNGAMLLTQIAKCPHCGGGMSLRTGKGGLYRYYACSTAATKGKTACRGRSIRMDTLDEIVLERVIEKIVAPARIGPLMKKLATRKLAAQAESQGREKELKGDLRKTEERIDRMHDAIADGLVGDGEEFRRNISKHKQRKDELIRLLAHAGRRREVPTNLLSPRNIQVFSAALTKRLRADEGTLRRAYVRHLVDSVVVGETEIRIQGSNAALLSLASEPDSLKNGEVPSFVQDWRTGWDSNPRYAINAHTLSKRAP